MDLLTWVLWGIIIVNLANISFQLFYNLPRQRRELIGSYYRSIRGGIRNARTDRKYGYTRFGDTWKGKHARLQRAAYDRTYKRP